MCPVKPSNTLKPTMGRPGRFPWRRGTGSAHPPMCSPTASGQFPSGMRLSSYTETVGWNGRIPLLKNRRKTVLKDTYLFVKHKWEPKKNKFENSERVLSPKPFNSLILAFIEASSRARYSARLPGRVEMSETDACLFPAPFAKHPSFPLRETPSLFEDL